HLPDPRRALWLRGRGDAVPAPLAGADRMAALHRLRPGERRHRRAGARPPPLLVGFLPALPLARRAVPRVLLRHAGAEPSRILARLPARLPDVEPGDPQPAHPFADDRVRDRLSRLVRL